MNRLFIILICVFFLTDILHSQDFKFVWQLQPSFFDLYKVTVIQRGLIRQIQIKKTFASDSIIKKITNIDCDSLFFILNDLEFTTKGSTTSKVIRMYCDTKHISDTNRLVLNNDTIRKGLLRYRFK